MAKARIYITLKEGILDPQGITVANALENMGYEDISQVRIGKLIDINLAGEKEELEEKIKSMCERLLANPVIEDFRFELGD